MAALDSLGSLLPERLLGALELTVAALAPAAPEHLTSTMPEVVRSGPFAFVATGSESEVSQAVRQLDQLAPGAATLVAKLVAALAGHESLVPLLRPGPDATGEADIAAAHGAAHLALAVITAAAVLGQVRAPIAGAEPPAVIGLALAATARLLRDLPMPPSYAGALFARQRTEYRLPRGAAGTIPVTGHRFALTEGAVPETADFSSNGLVAVVDGGAAIHTGIADGAVNVMSRVLEEPPDQVDLNGWDEVVEVSWRAATGFASVVGPDGTAPDQLRRQTPPWPGEYRLRVHARGRDEGDETESYQLIVWAAPAAPEIVHKHTDRLGHRLRGEPEPAVRPKPEAAYRWVRQSLLGDAATVTVVTGSTVDDVIRAFGGDPAHCESARELGQRYGIEPWVTVLAVEDAVLAVEFNGWQGGNREIMRALSRSGRAGSMYWNVNALTRLTLAEHGELLAAFEPGIEPHPDLAVFEGLDLADYRDKIGKGLVAVERFTGYGIRPMDLDRIAGTDAGYPISKP